MTVQHVALETRRADVADAVAFWALLGFAQVPEPEGLVGVATWVQAGDVQIHLLYAEEPVVARTGHVAVVAPAYAETQAALEGAGFAVRERTPYWGAPRCTTRSPGGHLVEIMAAPPG